MADSAVVNASPLKLDNSLPNSLLQRLKPQQVRGYALAKGWQRLPGVNGDIARKKGKQEKRTGTFSSSWR